jgi:hypothetical protein
MKKTREEYDAQAALMGMRYSPTSHSFFTMQSDNTLIDQEFDPDTLAPLTPTEVGERILANLGIPNDEYWRARQWAKRNI